MKHLIALILCMLSTLADSSTLPHVPAIELIKQGYAINGYLQYMVQRTKIVAQVNEFGRHLQHETQRVREVIQYPTRARYKISSVLGQIPIVVIDGKINAIMDFSGGGFKATVIYNFK